MDKSIHSTKYQLAISLLKQARVEACVTQVQMAARLNTTQTFVSKCERGERRLDFVELSAFCEAIDLKLIDYIKLYESKVGKLI